MTASWTAVAPQVFRVFSVSQCIPVAWLFACGGLDIEVTVGTEIQSHLCIAQREIGAALVPYAKMDVSLFAEVTVWVFSAGVVASAMLLGYELKPEMALKLQDGVQVCFNLWLNQKPSEVCRSRLPFSVSMLPSPLPCSSTPPLGAGDSFDQVQVSLWRKVLHPPQDVQQGMGLFASAHIRWPREPNCFHVRP